MQRTTETQEPEVDFEWVNAWQAAGGVTAAPAASALAQEPVAADIAEYQAHCELLAEALSSDVREEPAPAVPINLAALEFLEMPEPEKPASEPEKPGIAEPAADQLMRDIAEIERARDALAKAGAPAATPKRRLEALMLVPSRTTDSVPIVIGGVLALVMLTVFGAAAAMTRFGR